MKHNKEKLNHLINNAAIAIDAHSGVYETLKSLVSEITGEDLKLAKARIYRAGDRFRRGNDEFLLACPEMNKAILVSLRDGNRWANAIPVKDWLAVTQAELDQMSGSCPGQFILL